MKKKICLILEGTYPYHKGGVGVWAHELIERSPEYEFSVVALTGRPMKNSDIQYKLPRQIKKLVTVNLNEPAPKAPFSLRRLLSERSVKKLVGALNESLNRLPSSDFSSFREVAGLLENPTMDEERLMRNPLLWDVVMKTYGLTGEEGSVARFFWVWGFLARMVVRLFRAPIPQADVYHSAATGYSGLLGVLAKLRTGSPFLLSEHGLYLQERQMEVSFQESLQDHQRIMVEVFFEWISRWAYQEADAVTSLSQTIRQHQIQMGAGAPKCHILPNGIDLNRFRDIKRKSHPGFHMGLVGRVAPVKDVKLLIMAAKELLPRIPDLRVSIMGAWDDQAYGRECQNLVASLGLEEVVSFVGYKKPEDCYADLDLVVLCSLKEVQPLTILEAMAAGLPVVAPRSGAIPEMVSNIGLVFPPRRVDQLVHCIEKVYFDASLRKRMIKMGKKRAAQYDIKDLLTKFHSIYSQLLKGKSWPVSV